MKKRWPVIAGCLLAASFLLPAVGGRRPCKGLNASDAALAAVHLVPPDKTVETADCGERAGYLKELVVYRESGAFGGVSGQTVTFTLTTTDGSREEIMVCAPFAVINKTGYKADDEPCEALSRYGNGTLETVQ